MNFNKLFNYGYGRQLKLFYGQLGRNHAKHQLEQARKWQSIGATVNPSFFDATAKTEFTNQEMIEALLDLGIHIKDVRGRKWYQFWLSDATVRIENAIKQL